MPAKSNLEQRQIAREHTNRPLQQHLLRKLIEMEVVSWFVSLTLLFTFWENAKRSSRVRCQVLGEGSWPRDTRLINCLTGETPAPCQAWPRCWQKLIHHHHTATLGVTVWEAPVLPLILFGDCGGFCYPKTGTAIFLILDALLETCHTPSSVGSI